ncbi:MAG: HAMP domain-containing protein [Solirubrobacterales bacterium]|nr:HAMP domain-containing protein [Solirubrobacterales bacterium]
MLARFRSSLIWQLFAVLVLLLALSAGVFALLATAIGQQRDAAEDAGRAERAVAAAGELERVVIDMETGVRGYLIAGDEGFLKPYRRALDGRGVAAARLIDASTTRRTRAAATAIEDGMNAYVEDYLMPLLAKAQVSLSAARDEVRQGEGKRRVTALRSRFERLEADEEQFAAGKRAMAGEQADRAIAIAIGALVGSALLLALLGLYAHRTVIVPVRRLAGTADRIAAGDLTARVPKAEQATELGQTGRAFNSMAGSLERAAEVAREADRSKDEFIALVSHELRTPLTSIVGYVELLDEDAATPEPALDPAERRRFLEVINRNARRLLRLVGELLFVARVDAGGLDLDRERVELREVVADSVEAAHPAAEEAGVKLQAEVDGVPAIDGDSGRLGQAVDNLLSNAIKFTPRGGLVSVRARSAGEEALISVSDTGVGIPAADQARLFERFFRASSARSGHTPGVGLGLVITRAIVEGHGGRLELESEAGAGATFTLHFPLA